MFDEKIRSGSYLLFLPVILFVLTLFSGCGSTPEDTLTKIVDETKKSSPQVIDEYTTLRDCELLPDRTLKFYYVVKGVYTAGQRVQMEQAMKMVLLQRLKERKEIEFYLVNNVRFEHVFTDTNNQTVMHVQIEALDYK